MWFGNIRYFGSDYGCFCCCFIVYFCNLFRCGIDEFNVVFIVDVGKFFVFGKEFVIWVNGVSIGDFCSCYDIRDGKVWFGVYCWIDVYGFIGEVYGKIVFIGCWINCNGFDFYFFVCMDDMKGNFIMVGD